MAAESEGDPQRERLELAAAILLGLAAFVAAFTAYQSGKAGGDETDAQARANAALVDANFFYSQGNQQLAADNQLFLTLIEAEQEGEADLAAFIENDVMDDNLRAAVAYWRESDAVTPFDEAEEDGGGELEALPRRVGVGVGHGRRCWRPAPPRWWTPVRR